MPDDLPIKTKEQRVTDFLRSYSNGVRSLGVSNPDVSPGTEIYLKANCFAQHSLTVENAFLVQDRQRMPDTATGDDLDRIASIHGLTRQPESGSQGFMMPSTSAASITITTGAQLSDPNGKRYEVVTGGVVLQNVRVRIRSLSKGASTNLKEGVSLKWVGTPPANAATTATVDVGGLIGGTDSEIDSSLRSRLLERIRTRPTMNWAGLNEVAESVDPGIQKAFTYPAFTGPASVLTVVVKATNATDKERSIDDPALLSTLSGVMADTFPGWADIRTRSVEDQPTDISIGLSLSSGQWVDKQPFPQSATYSAVSAMASTSQFTIASTSAPIANVSHVCFVDYTTWTLKRGLVTSFNTVSPGVYQITLDVPFANLSVGDFIFPDALRMSDYVDALLEMFGTLGPGEISSPATHAGLYPRSLRYPLAEQSWPSSIGPNVLRFMSSTGEEVLDCSYLYRQNTTPTQPTSMNDAPFILVPKRVSFLPL